MLLTFRTVTDTLGGRVNSITGAFAGTLDGVADGIGKSFAGLAYGVCNAAESSCVCFGLRSWCYDTWVSEDEIT